MTIHGFSNEGEHFTLLNCDLIGVQSGSPGFLTATYDAQKLYVGTRFVDDEELPLATGVKASFTNFDAWNRYVIARPYIDQAKKQIANYIDLSDPNILNRKYQLPAKGLVLEESFDYDLKLPDEFLVEEVHSIFVSRFYRLTSATETLISTSELFNSVHHIGRLLTLLMGMATYFAYVEFEFPDSEILVDGKTIAKKNSCRLFFHHIGDIRQVKPCKQNDFLMKYDDIKNAISDIFNGWLREEDILAEIISPYVSDLYLSTYVENQFLSVVRGLESYHRYFGTIDTAEDAALEEARSNILAFIHEKTPPEFQEFFVSKVQYTGDISLRSRLNTLIKELPPELSDHLFGALTSNTRTKLIQQIIDTRNYYTHRDNIKKYPNVIESGLAVSNLTDRLASMLTFFCLTHLGIDRDIVAKRLIEWR